jgi:hypothetical protein
VQQQADFAFRCPSIASSAFSIRLPSTVISTATCSSLGIRHLALIGQRQGNARFFRPVDFTQQKARNHRRFNLA